MLTTKNKMLAIKSFLTGLLLLSFFTSLQSQRFPFTVVGVKDGLPQSSVFKVIQDPQGYIWMATESGLCRYDGYKFITYSIHNGTGAKFISDIKFDPQGRLWISTMGKGISWFDGENFHRFDKQNGLPSNQVRSLEFTDDGELFICTLDTGIVRLSKNKKPEILYIKDGVEFNNTWNLTHLRNGDILCLTGDGAVRFIKANNYQHKIICSASATLLNAFEASNGDIWVGGVEQLKQIKGQNVIDRSDLLLRYDGSSTNVWDIFEPKDKSAIYISTGKGLIILQDTLSKWLTVANGLPYNVVRDTYQDNYGNIWIGTYGGGAAILDNKGLDHFEFSDDVLPLLTISFVDDGKGKIWLGTDSHGIFTFDGNVVLHRPEPIFHNDLLALAMALNPVTDEVWVAALTGEIIKVKDDKIISTRIPKSNENLSILNLCFMSDGTGLFSTQAGVFKMGISDKDPVRMNEIPQRYIRSAFIDKDQYVWFLGDEGEIYRWKDGKATDFTKTINPDLTELDQGVYDAQHQLYWFTSNTGLIVWNGKGTYQFHSNNGLKSDSPWSITQDSIGRIWIGHEKGVECIDVDKKKITFIGYDQGFTPVETNSCVAMTDHKGDVWFGTISSASRVRIHDMKADDRTGVLRTQHVFVNKKSVYSELYDDTACPPIYLKYYQNTINIEIAALCYSNARDVRYSWFLENYDEEWVVDNEHREALYTNVPPGSYTFHAKAIEPNGFETNEIIIKITILRPFWHRPWFYLAEFSILGLFIFFSFRFSSNPHQNRLGNFMTLLTILIVFESLLIYLSTYINKFTGDIPVFQLVMNVILAATLNPLEKTIQKIMRRWALKKARNKK